MQAQVVLIPDESKKLIAHGLLALDAVQSALKKGLVVLHPSSTTLFVYEAILGRRPEPGRPWVSGQILPRGLCASKNTIQRMAASHESMNDPLDNRNAWVFRNGRLQEGLRLGDILNEIRPADVYVKAPNAMDPEGNTGVLYANPAGGGGTIGRVIARWRKERFHLLLPAGLEKLLPISIEEAAKKARGRRADRAMGMPCGLMPVPGQKIDERDAIRVLSGAEATPIAAGGLGGAGGAVTLAIYGEAEKVERALAAVDQVKGARLPPLDLLQCGDCPNPYCHLRGRQDRSWLTV